MRFCQPHWEQLKDAIRERGLFHLVADSGEAAVERLAEEAKGEATIATYDPLMDAHNMMVVRAIECGGLSVLRGDTCPLCEANRHTHDGMADEWITTCTNAILVYCEANDLHPTKTGGQE